MFEETFRNIDDVLRKEAGCTTELDYTEQSSWLLSTAPLIPGPWLVLLARRARCRSFDVSLARASQTH